MEKRQIDSMIKAMTEIARTAHAGQKRRDGGDYFEEHVQKVADAVEDRLKPIALGHDLVEDTSITIQDLINCRFPKYVTDAIDVLTHRNNEPNEVYWERISRNKDATPVKIADMKNNLKTSEGRQKEKYLSGLKFFSDCGYTI